MNMYDRRGITLLSLLVAGGTLCAQESVGTILGVVKDEQGAPVAQASLLLTGPRMLGQREVRTNAKGEFRMPLVPPGQYTLKASKEGFVGSRADFLMGAGQTLRQSLSIRTIHTASAVVEVVNVAAAVDKAETKTATNISQETLQNLPVFQRNALGALSLAPGVSGTSIAYAVVRGGIAGQTQTTVNGISVRDNVSRESRQTEFVLDDLTEDIAVVQSPLNAKYGNSSGGIVNVQTKNGSNSFQGSVRVKLKRPTWSALSNSTPDRFGEPTYGSRKAMYASPARTGSDDLSKTYEITLLGPIIKDRLTFSYGTRIQASTHDTRSINNILGGAHDGWRAYIPTGAWAGKDLAAYTWGVDPKTPTVSPVIGGDTKFSMNQYKLYFLITPEHQVEASFSRDEMDSFSPMGNMDTFADNLQSSTRDFKSLNYRGMLNSSMVLDLKWGRRQSRISFPSGPLDPIYVRVWGEEATSIFRTTDTGMLLTNGNNWGAPDELRDVETIAGNLNWTTSMHNVDAGVELLRERAYMPEQSGPNRRTFYTPGRLADGSYLAYNFVGSEAQTGSLSQTLMNRSGHIPEMCTWTDGGGSDARTKDFTNSIYANDQITFNAHWNLMLGFRYDNWKISDRTGTRIDTHAFSPRTEVKYDLRGDGMDLLSLSFADMRGTIGQGNLGGFSRKAGNIRRRYFWNAGSTTPHAVSYQELTDPRNYGYYYHYQNADALYSVNPDLRPEMARQLELGYRKAFKGGGFFRASLVYRRYKDLWYDRPTDVKITMQDPEGGNLAAPNGFAHYLTFDPMGKREHRALEMEWNYPILETASQKLDFSGNWTMARTYSTETWREGNTSDTPARWDDKFAALGISPDIYNPYGELDGTAHHAVRAWITWVRGVQGGIRSTLTLKGEYNTSSPRSRTQEYYFPANDLAGNALFTSGATGLPTTFYAYFNGRGRFDNGDSFYADLQWNLEFPFWGRRVLFANLTVNNVFNSQIPMGCGVGLDGNTRTWPDPDFSIRASRNGMANWGAFIGWGQRRSYSVDFGMRF